MEPHELPLEHVQYALALYGGPYGERTPSASEVFRLQLELLDNKNLPAIKLSCEHVTYISAIIPFDPQLVATRIAFIPQRDAATAEQPQYRCKLQYTWCCNLHYNVDVGLLCQKLQKIYNVLCAPQTCLNWNFRESQCTPLEPQFPPHMNCLDRATAALTIEFPEAPEMDLGFESGLDGASRLAGGARVAEEQRAARNAVVRLLDHPEYVLRWDETMARDTQRELILSCINLPPTHTALNPTALAEIDGEIRHWYKQLFSCIINRAVGRSDRKIHMNRYAFKGFTFAVELAAYVQQLWGWENYAYFVAYMSQNLPASSCHTIGRVSRSFRNQILSDGLELLRQRPIPTWRMEKELLSPYGLIGPLHGSNYDLRQVYWSLALPIDETYQPTNDPIWPPS